MALTIATGFDAVLAQAQANAGLVRAHWALGDRVTARLQLTRALDVYVRLGAHIREADDIRALIEHASEETATPSTPRRG